MSKSTYIRIDGAEVTVITGQKDIKTDHSQYSSVYSSGKSSHISLLSESLIKEGFVNTKRKYGPLVERTR